MLVSINTRLCAGRDRRDRRALGRPIPLPGPRAAGTGARDAHAVVTLRESSPCPRKTVAPFSSPLTTTYDDLLAAGSDEPIAYTVVDDNAAISLSYTSGTTGDPKGVVYTHRGAYLNSLGEVIHQGLLQLSVDPPATGGAPRGLSRRWPARTCACGQSARTTSGGWSIGPA